MRSCPRACFWSEAASPTATAASVAIQVGGALGVAVIGSILSTRYQHHLTSAVAGILPAGALHLALGSIGGALEVAANLPAFLAASLVSAASSALMSGISISLMVGAVVALGGALIALLALPARPADEKGTVDLTA